MWHTHIMWATPKAEAGGSKIGDLGYSVNKQMMVTKKVEDLT